MNWSLLSNSLAVGAAATLLAVTAGFWVALLALSCERRIRLVLVGCGIMVLALPPFLVANTWLHYLGLNGAWRSALPLHILTLPGTAGVLALLLWPITFLLVLGSWRQLHPAQLESDPAVRGTHLLRALLLPHARAALARAALITFVLALNNFTVPALLQTKVLPAEMWIRYNTELNPGAALRLSLPLIAGPLLLLWLLRPRAVPWKHTLRALPAAAVRRQLGAPWILLAAGVAAPLGALSLALPLGQILTAPRTWTELPLALGAAGASLWYSFLYASLAATTSVVFSFLAWRGIAQGIAWSLFLLPGMILGVGLTALLNASWTSLLYQTPALALLGLTLRYLAVPAGVLSSEARRLDPALADDSQLLGLNLWQRLRHLYWPAMAGPGLMAWYCVYLLCLWDVETILLLIPPGGDSAALRVFNLLHAGYSAQVNALCLALLGLGLAPLLVMLTVSRLGRGWLPSLASRWLAPALAAIVCAGCTPAPAGKAARLSGRFFSQAQVIATRGAGVAEVNKPRSVTVDSDFNLYVVDMTGRVQKFSPAGLFLTSWQMEQTDLGRPKGLGVDREGLVVVNEPHYSRINHFSPGGGLVTRWGNHGTNGGQLAFPRAVAVNSRNEIYLSEYGLVERVQRFSARGERWLGAFGSAGSGPGQLNRAEGLCIDARDRVYVADSCNHRIQVFSATGEFLHAYGSPGTGTGQLSYPYDICVDALGFQFVCEFGNSRIQVFDPDGRPVEIIGGPGSAPGRFNNPWGVALDPAGNLYVADALNHRVQKLIRREPLSPAPAPPSPPATAPGA